MNTLLVGLTQEEEKKLLEALGGFPVRFLPAGVGNLFEP